MKYQIIAPVTPAQRYYQLNKVVGEPDGDGSIQYQISDDLTRLRQTITVTPYGDENGGCRVQSQLRVFMTDPCGTNPAAPLVQAMSYHGLEIGGRFMRSILYPGIREALKQGGEWESHFEHASASLDHLHAMTDEITAPWRWPKDRLSVCFFAYRVSVGRGKQHELKCGFVPVPAWENMDVLYERLKEGFDAARQKADQRPGYYEFNLGPAPN